MPSNSRKIKKSEIQPKDVLIEKVIRQRKRAIERSKEEFYYFCRYMHPHFYKPTRTYLREMCNTMQDWWEKDEQNNILLINLPPRHGKSFTARLFVVWVFGKDENNSVKTKVISASFNETVSQMFAQQTRDTIASTSQNIKRIEYSDVFPKTKIKYGDSAKGFWSLEGSQEKNYLATSPSGTSTGIGANLIVVDDIVKDAAEAYNKRALESTWEWYNNTIVQRMEKPRKQLIIMTRWAMEDLAGRLATSRPNEVRTLSMPILTGEGDNVEMLCDDIMTYDEFKQVTQETNEDIIKANYFQVPIDVKGRLYTSLQTYSLLPEDITKIWAYTDTADRGEDYFCMIVFAETKEHKAYILDVIYTKEDMSKTETYSANAVITNEVNEAIFEGNNGGVGFKRAVERITREKGHRKTVFTDFHQSANKESRILSNSTWVMNNVYFPEGWHLKFPEFFKAITTFQKEGKNEHDDAPDALTGVAETINNTIQQTAKVIKRPKWIR